MQNLSDLEPRVAAGTPLSRAQAERVAACPDLVSVGALAETARRAIHGDRVTYGRVCVVDGEVPPADCGQAGEVRLIGSPSSVEAARTRVRAAAGVAGGAPVTAFSLADLATLAGGDYGALATLAASLRAEGLDAVAEVPLDRLGDAAADAIRALLQAGLGAWRAIVEAAPPDRLDLLARAEQIQQETGAFRALAPLARRDPRDTPSTGYDDVRLVALARLVCRSVPAIQVDWPLYGPKLAQVAIAYGADDIDGIAYVETEKLGRRRSPVEDIERQIRAAFAVPAERNGRYELRR
jgi:aminodeoxyfutalosine synthase